MQPDGPGRDILIDPQEPPRLHATTYQQYRALPLDIQSNLEVLNASLTCPYHPRTEKRLALLHRLLVSKPGRDFLDPRARIRSFFEHPHAIAPIVTWTWTVYVLRIILLVLDTIILGTLELAFGDIVRFYRIRVKAKQERNNLKRLRASHDYGLFLDVEGVVISPTGKVESRKEEEQLAELERRIDSLSQEKSQISRSFIALLIAIAALLVSIFAHH